MSKIAFIKSEDRYYNVARCLSLIKSEVISGLKQAKRIVIKPNCATDSNQAACTHRLALEAIFDFISPYVSSQIVLAEGTGAGNTIKAFENYQYFSLHNKYDFSVTDLNTDEYETIELLDRHGQPWYAQIAKTMLNADYIISVSLPKTHDSVVYTGVIKNATVGSLIRPNENISGMLLQRLGLKQNNKSMIHQGPSIINENIKRLYKHLPIKLAVLDGYEAMEGDGPITGNIVPTHYALVSCDPLAVDNLACNLMGINIDDVGYLALLGAKNKSDFIVGDDWQKNVRNFKMHPNFDNIRIWH